MDKTNKKYQYIQIGIASPEDIISWANPELQGKKFTYNPLRRDKVTYVNDNGETVEYTLKGEVKKHETINYRTLKPEKDGLFCEVIFGPQKDFQCACGKSRKSIDNHKVCEKCGVEITESKVRRERMGYIALAAPVVHTWYLRNTPSKIAILLDMKTKEVEDIVYLASFIIIDVMTDEPEDLEELYVGRILTEQEHSVFRRRFPFKYKAMTGAEAIKYLLQNIDVKEISVEIREELKTATKQKREKLIKRLEIAEAFAQSDNKPEWMVMDVIPVIPPDLRPMVQLDGGRFATTDLNDLYRRIITRNARLRKQIEQRSPEMLIKNEKRMLQDAVDALIDNSKRNKKVVVEKNRALKSLSDILRGKQGRFRQNLLGKRVDYSGRSVIVIGPDLKMYQCGIPREMALILFKPFIINYLRNKEQAQQLQDGTITSIGSNLKDKAGVKRAKELIEKGAPEAMEALENIITEHPVLLNRAPTLHRLSIQAFEPKLVEGKAIRLHPLVTTAFNADFDGDQMPVHVPLSEEAQTEARLLMLASKNILAPKDGKPIVTPSQDMILGNYYLSIERNQVEQEYSSFEEVFKAYRASVNSYKAKIIVNGEEVYRDIMSLQKAVEAGKAPSVGRFVIPAREGKAYRNPSEVELAYEKGEIDYHTRFVIPARSIGRNFLHMNESDPDYEEKKARNEELLNCYIITTYGKIILNQIFPENFPYVNEPSEENLSVGTPAKYFVKHGENYTEIIKNMKLTQPFKKKFLSMIISEVFKRAKIAETSKTLDKMKDIGFYYSTLAGVTVSAFDVTKIEKKQEIIDAAQDKANKYNKMFKRGTLSSKERHDNICRVWNKAKEDIEKEIKEIMNKNATVNDIFMMADSGARGSSSNFTQLAGMRGLMAKPNGESMEIPVKSCFSEGMKMSEFFISTHGARKGSTDTALKTAESGYLTRRLVDVSQDVTVTCEDCGTDKGMVVKSLYSDNSESIISIVNTVLDKNSSKTSSSRGKEVKSSYTLAKEHGYQGSVQQWISSLSNKGDVAKSSYEIICGDGFKGNIEEFLTILVNGTGKDGSNAKATFEAAQKAGYKGLLVTWLGEIAGVNEKNLIVSLKDRIIGRFTAKPVYTRTLDNKKELIIDKGEFINDAVAKRIVAAGVTEVEVRTLLTCNSKNGVCIKCYGSDLSTTEIVEKGEVVGIVAAQSIGEPGTQLTMRTFHSGGVAGGDDITQGLPRIQELFEAREPKGKGIISEIKGTIKSIELVKDNRYKIEVESPIEGNSKTYLTDAGKKPVVEVGQTVEAGDLISKGLIHPKELLRVSNVDKVEKYILKEVQKVYRSQGVEISDKHVEIIIKQMLQKVVVIDEGDTNLLPGTFVSKPEILKVITECVENRKRVPVVKPVILGITRASLKSDSFLSAASFQETTRVLTEAAIRGKIDTLDGLKENIIIGGLIPAGTGLVTDVEYEKASAEQEEYELKNIY